MSIPSPQNPDATPAGFQEVELLEFDENVPPRPEEDIADAARVPDPHDHDGSDLAGA